MPAMMLGSPASRTLVREIEPVPARRGIGGRRLSWIGDDEAEVLGEPVHACPHGEVVRVLGAAMEHDDQRRPAVSAARDIDLVIPRTCLAGECPREPGRPFRDGDRRRFAQFCERRGARTDARAIGLPQQIQDFSKRPSRTTRRAFFRRRVPRGGALHARIAQQRLRRGRRLGGVRRRDQSSAFGRRVDGRNRGPPSGKSALDDTRCFHQIFLAGQLRSLTHRRREVEIHVWVSLFCERRTDQPMRSASAALTAWLA